MLKSNQILPFKNGGLRIQAQRMRQLERDHPCKHTYEGLMDKESSEALERLSSIRANSLGHSHPARKFPTRIHLHAPKASYHLLFSAGDSEHYILNVLFLKSSVWDRKFINYLSVRLFIIKRNNIRHLDFSSKEKLSIYEVFTSPKASVSDNWNENAWKSQIPVHRQALYRKLRSRVAMSIGVRVGWGCTLDPQYISIYTYIYLYNVTLFLLSSDMCMPVFTVSIILPYISCSNHSTLYNQFISTEKWAIVASVRTSQWHLLGDI